MEEAVSKIGLRYDCSFLIWNSYLDLEKMIMSSMDGELAAERRQKILKLYGRMLRIPHMDMTQSWNDYCAFLGKAQLILCFGAFSPDLSLVKVCRFLSGRNGEGCIREGSEIFAGTGRIRKPL